MSDDLKEVMKRVYGSNRPVDDKEVSKDQNEEEVKEVPKEQPKKEDYKVKEVLKKIYGSSGFISDRFKEAKKIGSEDAKKIEQEVMEEVQDKKSKEITASGGIEETQKKEVSKGELVTAVNPHIKDKQNVRKIMWAVVIALLPATIAGIYFFKFKAVWTIILSVIAAVAAEYLINRFAKKEMTIKDGSAVITGLLLALVLPPGVPFWIPILGAFFAISIGKLVFGGLGHNIFNPALVGRAFLVASWPVLMAKYILPDGITGATPLGLLKSEGIKTAYSNLFLGNIGGAIGETSALALLIGAAFLFYNKIIDWRIPTAYIGTVVVFAIILGQDPLFHILAGGLLIGAFFMATDYVTSPLTKKGRLIFGLGCGFLTIIIRLYGGLVEGVMYSILLMNSVTPLIDRFTKLKPFGFQSKMELDRLKKEGNIEEERRGKIEEILKANKNEWIS